MINKAKKNGSILLLTMIFISMAVTLLTASVRGLRSFNYLLVRMNKMVGQDIWTWRVLRSAVKEYNENQGRVTSDGINVIDEASFLNINALSVENINILRELFFYCGADGQSAAKIINYVLDWKDADDNRSDFMSGPEKIMFGNKPVKNRPFDSLNELNLLDGVSKEIFSCLFPLLTVIPKHGNLFINFDTAPLQVMGTLAKTFAGAATNTDKDDAESLIRKIADCRARHNREKQSQCFDDIDNLRLNARERSIFLSIYRYRIKRSQYVRGGIKITGRQMIIDRNDGKIISSGRFD